MTTNLGGLALPLLFTAVKDRFAADAGVVDTFITSTLTGTSVPTLSGTPTAPAKTQVRFPIGGTIGVDGITYQVSTDGGATWAAPVALGLATTIDVLGVTLALAAGTVVSDDAVSWHQSGPDVVQHVFGWSEAAKRSGKFRIVWVPGEDGNVGDIGAARQPGRIPARPLATLDELFTVFVEARDASAPKDEMAQYVAARALFDAWYRAVYRAAHGTFAVRSTRWEPIAGGNPLGAVSQAGATIRVVCSVQAMLADSPFALVTPSSADTTTTVLDEVETQTDTPA